MRSVVMLTLFTLLITGYGLGGTLVARLLVPHQASGSVMEVEGQPVGSELIGQNFTASKYFWSRPSATTPPYNAAASSSSNYGPLHADLHKRIAERIADLKSADPEAGEKIPADLVTASGSGLDPHISPAAAEYQLRRVAKARGVTEDKVRSLVRQYTEGRQLGLLGEPRVNLLLLNRALDAANPS